MPSNTDASRITSTFKKLSNEIASFTKQITSAEAVARKFDGALKLDPSNLAVANEKFNNLSKALDLANKRLEASKQSIQELNKEYADDRDNAKYKKRLSEATTATKKYAAEVDRLTVLVKNAKQEVDKANPSLNSFAERLKKNAKESGIWKDALKSAKIILVSLIASVVKLTKEMSNLGKELVANAEKYGTTAELLQEQSYLFYTLTGNADAYTSSLQAMNSVMAQILSGRGQSQLQSLAQIGINKSDISGKTTAEAYEVIFNALRNVEDQATATAVAVKLFGDSGAYVAEMANKSDAEIAKYTEKIKESGVISTESAQRLAELSDDLYLFNLQLKVVGAEIITSLAPAIKAVSSVLLSLSKGLSGVYEAFGSVTGSILLFSSILTIKMIPSIIKLIVQTKLATQATWGQVVAQTALISVLTGGVLAITAIGGAIGASRLATKQATAEMDAYSDSVKSATEAAKEYDRVTSKLKSDLSVSTENIEKTNSTYSSNVTFTIKAEGDSPISDENAKKIGEITVDQINKALGGIIA